MSKQVVQDILPPRERTIRRIPLPEKRSGYPAPEGSDNGSSSKKPPTAPPPPVNNIDSRNRRPKRLKILILFIAIIAVVLFFAFFAFSKAEIKVTPRELMYDTEESLAVGESENDDLSFKIATVTKEASREVESSGEEMAERRANGEIIIFNNYSSKSQPLIKNTRFQTPEGLIYRINESVSVPGTTEKDGKTVPGQLRVRVYADSPGEDYNIGLTDFTIPGFKGMPQYEKFFARSTTEMTGGFIGKVKTVDEKVEESTRTALREELQTLLKADIINQVPKDYILLPLTVRTSSNSLVSEEAGSAVKIKEQGTLSGIILPREKLENIIASSIISEPTETKITNLEVLSYEIEDLPEKAEDLASFSSFKLEINGKARIVWVIPEAKIKESLAGKPKKDLKDILFQFSSIEKAEATVKPFWKRSFPDDPEKIYMEIVGEKEPL